MIVKYQSENELSGPANIFLVPQTESDQRTIYKLHLDQRLSCFGRRTDGSLDYEHATVTMSSIKEN
jgi:hypothetical protein